MKQLKIITLIFITILVSACTKKVEIEKSSEIDEKLKNLEPIVLTTDYTTEGVPSNFAVFGYSASIGPAFTYSHDELVKENSKANINIASELSLQIMKYEVKEEFQKILIKNIKIKNNDKSIKSYALIEGDSTNYIDLMRNHEIKDEFIYEKDLSGNNLKNGKIYLAFTNTFENLITLPLEKINNKTYKEVLKDNNITNEDLKYTVEFDLIIYTDKNIYALKLEYNSDINVYDDVTYKNINFQRPIYFNKIKSLE